MSNKNAWKASMIFSIMVSTHLTPALSFADSSLEEVVILGSRGEPRSVADSPVPVDVIGKDELSASGSNDLLMQLQTAIPSLNVHLQPISDAASMIRPANLRGLSADSTLIMVNGKRRHRASVIAFQGGGINDGSQGADISVIPSIALKSVEVLRDGAAAQYGSDAIAGVINFVLNDASEGGSMFVKQGQYSEGDGATTTLGGNMGMPLTDNGFMNLSFQVRNADATSRSVQRNDAQKLIDNGNKSVLSPAQIWGSPIVDDDVTFFFNSGLDLGNGSEAYMFGNYSERDVDGGFYYRNPNDRGGVFTYDWNGNTVAKTNDKGEPIDDNGNTKEPGAKNFVQAGTEDDDKYRLVADLGGCQEDLDSSESGIEDFRKVKASPKDDENKEKLKDELTVLKAHLEALIDSEKCYVHNQKAAGGYTPRFGSNITDTSLTAGTRGEFSHGFLQGYHYDFSGSVGRNESDFGLRDTFNPSMGPDSKRDFSTGSYIQLEKRLNMDFHKQLGDTSFATGYEWSETSFEVISGEPASWQKGEFTIVETKAGTDPDGVAVDKYGDTESEATDAGLWQQATHIDLTTYQPFSVGSHGFAGFSGDSAGTFTRRSYALYTDVESQINDQLLVGGALRYENFSSFGDTTNYKMTFNYQVHDNLALRGSHSTGFRAPTQGQANVVNTQTTFDDNGELIQAQTLPAFKLGHGLLQPEESVNFTFGAITSVNDIEITADIFSIEVKDRIGLTSNRKPTEKEIQKMTKAGIADAGLIGKVNYFTNDFDTKTNGFDLVANYGTELFNGNTNFTLAYNYTKTKVNKRKGGNTITSDFKVKRLEKSLPNHRATFTMKQNWEKISSLIRANYYGSYFAVHADSSADKNTSDASEAVTVDAEATYNVSESFNVSFGGQNIFDQEAETLKTKSSSLGGIYYETSPYGFEGAFWYLKAGYNF